MKQVPLAIATIGTVPKQLQIQEGVCVKFIYNKMKIHVIKIMLNKIKTYWNITQSMDIIYIINIHINQQTPDQSHYLLCFMSIVVMNL